MRGIFLLVATLMFVGMSYGQYGKATQSFDNVKCWAMLSIPGVTANGKPISGTKVQLSAAAGAGTNSAWMGDPTYDNAQFYRAVLKINGSTLIDRTYSLGGPVAPETLELTLDAPQQEMQFSQINSPPSIRFASTHFNHDSNVIIEVECWFALYESGVWTESVPVTTTITPKAFNKGMTYEHGDFAGLGSTSGGLAARIEMENMKHMEDEIDARNSTWTKSQFVNDLALATALHAGSHGVSSGLYDNYGSLIEPSDVYSSRAAAATNGVPPINVAFIDACYLGSNTTWLQNLLHPYSS
ncbi:MAG TPA: hypothetical protein PLX06_00875 [Fimbriimonadaceae bacterium]|nr:hypothetical protein [Fimbriimonadaceae bacterium]